MLGMCSSQVYSPICAIEKENGMKRFTYFHHLVVFLCVAGVVVLVGGLLLGGCHGGGTIGAAGGKNVTEKEKSEMENNKPVLEKFEVVKCGPFRFIGKTMYARAGKSGDLCGALFHGYGDWVFKTLDGMKEYATEDIHNAALVAWDKYDEKNKLMSYTIGRFMKADTPVPEDMDYFDLPEGFVVKGFISEEDHDKAYALVREEVKRQGKYVAASWIWSAEIYPKPDEGGKKKMGVYIAGELIKPGQ